MNITAQPTASNFAFLAKRYPELERIGALSERYFSDDPIISLITIRQFGEGLAQLVAARWGLFTDANEPQADLLRRLRVDGNYPAHVLDLFHKVRIDGNAATHRREGDHATALTCPLGLTNALASTPEFRHKSGFLILMKRSRDLTHHDP